MGIGLYYAKFNSSRINPIKSIPTQDKQTTLQKQTVTIGNVEYVVTPKNINSSSKTWEFEIVLDTHTGSLDQDLVSLIGIADNKGNKYQATQWVGDPPGGHHREGVLQFSPITEYPKSIELKIQAIEATEEATLLWNL